MASFGFDLERKVADVPGGCRGTGSPSHSLLSLLHTHPSSPVDAATTVPLHTSHIEAGWRPSSDREKSPSHQIPCSPLRFPHPFRESFSSQHAPNRETLKDPRPHRRRLLPIRPLPPSSPLKMYNVSPLRKIW